MIIFATDLYQFDFYKSCFGSSLVMYSVGFVFDSFRRTEFQINLLITIFQILYPDCIYILVQRALLFNQFYLYNFKWISIYHKIFKVCL